MIPHLPISVTFLHVLTQYRKTGLLVGESGSTLTIYKDYLNAIQSVSKECGKFSGPEVYLELTGAEANQRFPGEVRYEDNYRGYVEYGAGLLKADKALRAFLVSFPLLLLFYCCLFCFVLFCFVLFVCLFCFVFLRVRGCKNARLKLHSYTTTSAL